MKLQKAFFLVLGLAFLVSLGSLVSGTPGQKAQTITSVTSSNSRLSVDRLSNSDSLRNVGTNSILLTSPSVSTSVSPNQTLPMTCEITVESGFRVFDLVFAAYSPATGEVVFHHEDNVSFADGAYSVDVTIPSTASEYIVMNCVAEYWNPDSSQYRQIASNYPVNVTRTTQPPVSTAPTAPSNLSGSATGQTSANITWSDNSNNETSFTLQRATNTSFTAGLTTLSPSANATSQSITGLAAGTTYYFRIQANNGSLSSGWSNVATVTTTSAPTNDTTAPSRPAGMTSSNRTSYQIQVNWTPSTDNVAVAGYYLYRNNGGSTSVNNTTPIATLSPNETSYNDVGLQARKGYRYRVRAFDAAGNLSNWGLVGTSNTATTLTASTLAVTMPASSSVTVTNATSSSLQVNWSPSTSGEIFDYKVYANNGGSTAINTTTPVGIISTNPSNPSYCFQSNKFCFVHTGLNASTTYKYQVAASDPANNNSNRTSAKSGTTLVGGGTGPVAPTAPSNLSGSATGQTSANITWSDNSNNETSFTLQRATNTSFTAGLTTLSPSANATSQSITGLAAGTTYYFRIQANNGSLSSGWSNVATLVMPAVQNPPSAPTGVSVGSPTTSSLTVSWSAVADTTSYKVYRVLSSGVVDMAVPPVVVPVPNLSTTITNLSSGTAYRFLVTANNAAGESTLTPTGSGASANNATGTTSSPQITVSSLSLVRTDGTVIESLDGGESINVGTQNGGVGVNISVKANTVPATAGSVVFTLQRPNSTVYNLTENQEPYTLFGDSGDTTIVAWQNLILGGYTLTVTPYAGANGTGQVGVPRTVQFQIVNNDDSTPAVNPTNVLVTYRSVNQIKLGWTNSTSTDVASYRVHRDNVSVGVVNHPTNTFTDTTVNGTSNYAYKVISIDTSNNEAALPSTASNAPTLSTAFTLNNQVETNTNAQVKSAPESATVAGTQASGSIGTITNGPVWVVGGVQYWYVNFNSGTDGWVNETNLDIYVAPPVDTTPPTVTITAPTNGQVLPSGTTSTNLTVTTNEAATCKWSTSNQSYSAMTSTMSGSGTTSHTASVTGLTNGTSYTRYVACSDSSNNVSTTQSRSFSVDNPADTTAPTVTITAPTQNQVLPSGTTSTNLTVTTNENATCKWSANNVAYTSMVDVFTGTNTTSHTYGLLGLTNGTSYTRYVACADAAGNASTSQARTFSVQSAPTTDTSSPTYPNGNASFTVVPSPTNPQGALVLDWADATDLTPPVTYKVSRSTVSTGPFYQVAPAFTASTFTDTEGGALTSESTRYYQLVACDAVTPTQNCTTAITASGTTAGEVDNTAPTVTITAPAQNEVLPSNTTSTTLTVSTNEPATCKWSTTNTTYGNMTNTMSGSGSSSHSLAISVASGTSYTRYVACSDSSNNASTTQSRSFSVATFVPDTSAPTGSLGVTVGSPTATSLTISWNALTDATPPINYRLYRSSTQTGTYTQVGGNITGTSYVDSGRSASTTYWYKVDACDSVSPTANCTSQSTAVSGTTADVGTEPPITTTCPTVPALPASSISTPSVQLCAEVSNSPNRITLKWAAVSGRTQSSATISRKTSPTATSWTQVGTVSGSTTSWTDTNVTSGQYYEYQVKVNTNAYGYISAGINVPLESYKGKMVLVIDNTFQTSLASQINTLINDLTADRWVVIPKYVSRTDTPTAVRNVIKAEYDADPTNVKAVYLLGHIPVPRVGNSNGDGHGEPTNGYPYGRAVSSDTYYGEMTQEFNKLSNGCSSSSYSEVVNPSATSNWSLWPINGSQWSSPFQTSSFLPIPPITHKFCLSNGQTPSALELQVGRVDMSNLTVYSQSEQTLLSNYLTKAREFKRNVWAPTKRAFIRDAWINSGWTGGSYILGTFPSVFGSSSAQLVYDHGVNDATYFNDALPGDQSYLFLSARYGGTTTAVDYTGGGAYGNSYTYASSGFEMGGVFNQFMGSYLPEWNDYNSLLRTVLADGKALVSVHADDRAWYWHSMGIGQNIGHATRMSVNNNSSGYIPVGGIWSTGAPSTTSQGNGFMTLLGDPSLRAEYIAPVSSLTLSNSSGKTAMSWPAAASATHGYNVYKITSSSITKLNGAPITGTSFTSTDNYTSGNKYMVTAVKLEITNSGTYYNESLGAIATVGGTVVGDTTPPSVPTDLAITNTSQNMVSLSWTASSDAVGVSGYNIFRSDTQSGTYVQKNENPINSTSYNDFSVSPNTTYYYKVSAFDAAGNQSEPSSSVPATTPSAPSGGQVLGINGPVGPNLTDNATSCTNPSGGTIYYVDAVAGNDSNNGTSTSTPWKTISRLNTASFPAGTMTCFKRGGVYPGTITLSVSGTQSSPIRFDAYGSGAAPIISGFDQVTTPWVTYSGNIWKTTITTGLNPEQLQVAGVVQNLARHPNTGWLQTTNKTGTTTNGTWIGTQAANSLIGANIIEYANPWAWFKGQVTAKTGDQVTFTPGASIFYEGVQFGWSYGFENKLSFLDSAGEWYYNNTTGELYFWAPGNANPNNLSIEISARVEGIRMTDSGARDTQFKNLVFEGYSGTVVYYGDQRRNVYENLEIRKSGKAIGVWSQATSATDGVLIKNNYIHNIYKDGIYFVGGNGHTIEGNVIKDIGIDPWYAGSGSSWSMIAINTGTSNQTIKRNIIENIGYTGIFVNGSGVVEENHLKNMLVSVTDGAAIMFNLADGLSIRKNIIEEVYSQNMSAMPLPYESYPPDGISNGIYYGDDTIQNTTVENNVVVNVGNDAYVMDHGAEYINNRTINNIGFNFGRGGIFFSDASIYRDIPHWYTSWATGSPEQVFGVDYGSALMNLCLPYENSTCFRPQFNDIVTGNKLYGLKPDRLDPYGRNGSRGIYMFYSYSDGTGANVDYGTINNNYYYNRLSANRVTTRIPVPPNTSTTDYTMSAWRDFSGEDMPDGENVGSTESTYPVSSTRPEPDIYLNPTASPITRSVNGCTSNNTPLTGVQTIQPFSALVVEYGNC